MKPFEITLLSATRLCNINPTNICLCMVKEVKIMSWIFYYASSYNHLYYKPSI
jgi:membrane protein insertase Oxa1/YidC/SpoIIIJ